MNVQLRMLYLTYRLLDLEKENDVSKVTCRVKLGGITDQIGWDVMKQ